MNNSSAVWKYFTKSVDKKFGRCKLCLRDVKTGGNTTNLHNHLKRQHKIKIDPHMHDKQHIRLTNKTEHRPRTELSTDQHLASTTSEETVNDDDEDENELVASGSESESLVSSVSTVSLPLVVNCTKRNGSSVQPLINESIMSIQSFSEGGVKCTKITNALIYMITKDQLPLNFTEKEGFQYFKQVALPLYKAPGRKAVTSIIKEKYDILSTYIQESLLSKVSHVTITTDVWTEIKCNESYLGVTAHFYLNKKLHNLMIGVTELTERHTSENLAHYLQTVFDQWKIDSSKITAVVTDNGANIVKAVTILFGRNRHLPCFAHTINLVAAKSLELDCMKHIENAVKAIVTFFKDSTIATDDLKKQQGDKYLKLIQAVKTRWNSTYYMLERFNQLSEHVASVLLRHPKAPRMLSAGEIQIIEDMLAILQPLEKVTKEISGELYVTASKIIPIVNCLLTQLTNIAPKTEDGHLLKNAVITEVKKRFSSVEDNKILAISTILDPRFKKLHFSNPVACAQTIADINRSINSEAETELKKRMETETIEDNETEGIWSYHQQLVKKNKAECHESTSALEMNLKYYLSQAVEPFKADPFEFWEKHKELAPRITEIAYKYLSVMGTSVPSERLFSKAGDIKTACRNRLSPTKLQQLLFLSSLDLNFWNM